MSSCRVDIVKTGYIYADNNVFNINVDPILDAKGVEHVKIVSNLEFQLSHTPGIELLSIVVDAGTYNPGTKVWSVPSLSSAASKNLTYIARVTDPEQSPFQVQLTLLTPSSDLNEVDNVKIHYLGGLSVGDLVDALQTLTGSQGINGSQGTTGTQGLQGLQGLTGTQGLQGGLGLQGPSGGPQGTLGTQGSTGSQGTQGIQGTTGSQGLGGTNGTQGAIGTQGTMGIQGYTGNQGTIGIQGSTGSMGLQGYTGIQGTQGTQGRQGIQGIQGPTGIQGQTGLQGLQGVIGTQGTSGVTPDVQIGKISTTLTITGTGVTNPATNVYQVSAGIGTIDITFAATDTRGSGTYSLKYLRFAIDYPTSMDSSYNSSSDSGVVYDDDGRVILFNDFATNGSTGNVVLNFDRPSAGSYRINVQKISDHVNEDSQHNYKSITLNVV